MIDWGAYPNFDKREFDCQQTGENMMAPEFMERLQAMRSEYGRPMRITSGYRSPRHSIEAAKPVPGTHAIGIACDIAANGQDAYDIIALAIKHGMHGIGIAKTFVHIDMRPHSRRTVWVY